MLFNHALQYSCLRFTCSHLAYLLGHSSTSTFCSVYEVLSTLCTSDISTQWHLNCHSASFLIGVRRALPARSQREKGDRHVFTCQSAQPNQNTMWSKTVSPLTFKVHSALVDFIRCGWKYRWVKYPISQAVSGNANLYSFMYLPHSSLTIQGIKSVKNFIADETPPWRGQNTSTQKRNFFS